MPIRELKPQQLKNFCDPSKLPFKTTDDVPELKGTIGHQRAIEAIDFGLANKMKGFNIFLLGDSGSGKTSILRKLLNNVAQKEETPPDWIYIHNFKNNDRPIAYSLPTGMGTSFKKDMSNTVKELKRIIPKLLEGEKYNQLGQQVEKKYKKKEDKEFRKLSKIGKQHDLEIEQISGELLIQVIKDGSPLDHEEFEELSSEEKKYYENKVHEIQDEISDFVRSQRNLEREKQEKIRELDHQEILKKTEYVAQDLKKKYKDVDKLDKWIDEMWKFIPTAFEEYQKSQEDEEQQSEIQANILKADFKEFRVNLFIDNQNSKGAPVIFENAPSFHNLMGSVEYREQYGLLSTDFTLIKPGALHKANGGYLVIQVNDLMRSMYAWDVLKRSLRNKEIVIEEVDIEQRTRSTVSPKPSPIELKTKVVLIGNYDLYYFLLHYDEDFSRLFKVKSEFDDVIPRTATNIRKYAGFIRRLVREDELTPFSASAVAKIIEQSSRYAEHQKKISARFIDLINLVSESNFWAKQSKSKTVEAKHVSKALNQRKYRFGKIEFDMYENIREGSILLDMKGKVVGQINGIAVYDMGDHAFGIPSRITSRTYVGRSGILHVEREAKMSGQIHDKASLIIVGILGGLYAQKKPLSLSASICFEQMYGSIEGDSASCAELFALISSLSGIPIDQGLCVTGSLNQRGEVQPIGGVNEKIEGVYKICKAKGLNGKQGVIIPIQNVINLALDDEVIEAVEKGKFHIYSIKNINDGISLVMNKPANEIHKLVMKKLESFRKALDE